VDGIERLRVKFCRDVSPERMRRCRPGALFDYERTTVSGVSELGAQLEISSTSTGWKLAGEIDAHTAPDLATALVQLPDGDVVVDVADVSFMDSSGLNAMHPTAAPGRPASSNIPRGGA